MPIRQEDIIAQNEEIWASMLGFTIAPTDVLQVATQNGGSIGACVQLVGAWNGAVRLDCAIGLAREAAGCLLSKEASATSMDDIRDTVGELANMAAGSMKSLLPQPTHISLPAVADGANYDLTVRKGRLLLQCPFECRGQVFQISLLERAPELDAARYESLGVPLTSSVH